MGAEIVPGETIPAETGLTDVAVSFTKGCYPGQELVERMDSRARRPRATSTCCLAEPTTCRAQRSRTRAPRSAPSRRSAPRRCWRTSSVGATTSRARLKHGCVGEDSGEEARSDALAGDGAARGHRRADVGHRHQLSGAQEDLRLPGLGRQPDGQGRSGGTAGAARRSALLAGAVPGTRRLGADGPHRRHA